MKLSILPLFALISAALAAPMTRDLLGNAEASVDQLIRHLKADRDVADMAIRRLQTKVLDYRQSVEGYGIWRGYAEAHENAVSKAESMKQFLMKVDGIHGLRQETAFGFQGML